jgi:hypothetical protein
MEFPDDVLSLIHAFSQPRMKYVNEYFAGFRKIRNTNQIGFHQLNRDVKRKLYTEDAYKILTAWVMYADSYDFIYQVPYPGNFLDRDYLNERNRRKDLFQIREHELRLLVYGNNFYSLIFHEG